MQLFAIGISHHTAPITLRERVAFSLEQIASALAALKSTWLGETPTRTAHPAPEAAILSTCNRTELYCAADDADTQQHAVQWLSQYHKIPIAALSPHLYTLPQHAAVRHAFRVAAGLDSMVLGETQILGQLKGAVQAAAQVGALGTYLHQLFQRAFAVAKQVRGQTEIGAHSVSMAAAAVKLAQRIFDTIAQQRVLFIGAGKMIELSARYFAAHGPREIAITNRTPAAAQKLAARFAARAIPWADLLNRLPDFDIIVSCTASPLPIIGLGAVERAVRARKRRPIFIADFAVPRDIEPEVAQLQDVFLYTIDDLGAIVGEGQAQRQAALAQADMIIEGHVQNFMQWMGTRRLVPTIRQLYAQAQALRCTALKRAANRMACGEDPSLVLESLSKAMMHQFIHGPIQMLTQAAPSERAQLMRFLPQIFERTDQ